MKHSIMRHIVVVGLIFLGITIMGGLGQAPTAQAGGVIGSGTPASCQNIDGPLQTAIDTGGLITFNCGPTQVVITITTKIVNSTIAIDGGNLINLSGGGGTGLFSVQTGGHLRLMNIELRDGFKGAGNGGAVSVDLGGSLTTDNTRFINNHVGEGNGGAIYAFQAPITITSSLFQNNSSSSGSGGAVYSGGTAKVANITGSQFISNTASFAGGALYAEGVLNLTASLVVSNTLNSLGDLLNDHGGPGIVGSSTSQLNINQTTVEKNYDVGYGFQPGGGLRVEGQALLRNSTVYSNNAWGGGGAYVAPNATLVVINSTFSHNDGRSGNGGGLYNEGSTIITNTTFAGNFVDDATGPTIFNDQVRFSGATVRLFNTLLYLAPIYWRDHCGGHVSGISSSGFNLTSELLDWDNSPLNSCNLSAATNDIVGIDPNLLPLADNGGPTKTHAVSAGSPAIGAGNLAGCPSTDQRGVARAGRCDTGAFQFDICYSLALTYTVGFGKFTITPPNCAGGYTPGTPINLAVEAQNGYKFTGWSGLDSLSDSAQNRFVINQNLVLKAYFEPINQTRKPIVVLIHGFHGKPIQDPEVYNTCTPYGSDQSRIAYRVQASDFTNGTLNAPVPASDFGSMPYNLYQDGWDVWIARVTTGKASTPSIKENTECLDKQLKQIQRETGSKEVVLISHSMGGLIGRSYTYYFKYSNPIKVKRLITIGTPHDGLPWGDSLCLTNSKQVAACEFSTGGIYNFNFGIKNDSRVIYDFIAGVSNPAGSEFLIKANQGPRNDGVVGEQSALGRDYKGSGLLEEVVSSSSRHSVNASHSTVNQYPIVCQALTYISRNSGSICHQVNDALKTWQPSYFNVTPNDNLTPTETYLCIRQLLGIPNGSCPSTSSWEEADAPFANITSIVQLPVVSGQLTSASPTITHTFPVDMAGAGQFTAAWDTGALTFTLTTPTGQVIDPTYASNNPAEVAFFTTAGLTDVVGLYSSIYQFTTTVSGIYTATLTASDFGISNTTYFAFGTVESALNVILSENNDPQIIGSQVPLSVTVQSGGIGVTGAEVTANLWNNGITATVPLIERGNGVYTATYTIPDAPGYLSLSIIAQGAYNGKDYARQVDGGLLVAPNTVQITGPHGDIALDEEGNGLKETLAITLGLNVSQPGSYLISGVLKQGATLIANNQISVTLTGGQVTAILPFSGAQIRASGLNGPYTLTDVTISDLQYQVVPTVWQAQNVWTTAAYDVSEFGTACYLLTKTANGGGAITVNPAPNCNQGLQYVAGDVVTLTAEAYLGHAFAGWSGDIVSNSETITLTLNEDKTVTANFTITQTGIFVNTTVDEFNTDGDCSLREAIRSANLDIAVDACASGNGADTILVPAGIYTLAIPGQNEDAALTGDLDITSNLTILGAGAEVTIIDGASIDRVFEVLSGNPTLSNITIENGVAVSLSDRTGGILIKDASNLVTINNSRIVNNNGVGIIALGERLLINESLVSGNTATNGVGGIIASLGFLTINNSTISNNYGGWGGISVDNGFRMLNSTVSGNVGTHGPGGLRIVGQGIIINSTISGNQGTEGGGIWTNQGLGLINTTIVSNSAISVGSNTFETGRGGGIYFYGESGVVTSTNVIIANNQSNAGSPDCYGQINSLGYNLLSSVMGCSFIATATDKFNLNPLLGFLANNGGATQTHALLSGSPAINAGTAVSCPVTDQRGIRRPQGGRCDIGAYEFEEPSWFLFLPIIRR